MLRYTVWYYTKDDATFIPKLAIIGLIETGG